MIRALVRQVKGKGEAAGTPKGLLSAYGTGALSAAPRGIADGFRVTRKGRGEGSCYGLSTTSAAPASGPALVRI